MTWEHSCTGVLVNDYLPPLQGNNNNLLAAFASTVADFCLPNDTEQRAGKVCKDTLL